MAHLVHIGNSLGIRIPKAIINQVGFKEETVLEFKVVAGGILISAVRFYRKGWLEAFKKGRNEELLMGEKINNIFDAEEWEC